MECVLEHNFIHSFFQIGFEDQNIRVVQNHHDENANKLIKRKGIPAQSVRIGEVILCKMRGSCEWPGLVIAIDGNKITIKFFGDNSTHTTTIKNIFCFSSSVDLMVANLSGRKRPLYSKAIREAELALRIPLKNSLVGKNTNG